jgi:hypothetical protein
MSFGQQMRILEHLHFPGQLNLWIYLMVHFKLLLQWLLAPLNFLFCKYLPKPETLNQKFEVVRILQSLRGNDAARVPHWHHCGSVLALEMALALAKLLADMVWGRDHWILLAVTVQSALVEYLRDLDVIWQEWVVLHVGTADLGEFKLLLFLFWIGVVIWVIQELSHWAALLGHLPHQFSFCCPWTRRVAREHDDSLDTLLEVAGPLVQRIGLLEAHLVDLALGHAVQEGQESLLQEALTVSFVGHLLFVILVAKVVKNLQEELDLFFGADLAVVVGAKHHVFKVVMDLQN